MRTTIFRSSWLMMLLAGALVAPAQLSAQRADSTRAHVVKAGDTLWSLAATYLGDSQRWRELLALNSSVRAPDALTVGSTIRIPARATSRPASQDTARREVRIDPPPRAQPAAAASDTPRRTIFFGAQPAGGFTRPDSVRRVSVDSGVPARVYEGLSAPYVTDDATLEGAGRCLSVGPTGTRETGGVLLQGTLSVELPAGTTPDTGSRWLLVRRGPVLPALGTVVVPTGVVRLTSNAGTTAEIVAQFDAMSCSDAIVPAVLPPSASRGRLTPVTDGATGTVVWLPGESLLPTLQHALILDIGIESGVRVGDRVTVFGGNGTAVVATAEVVRVDRRSATALVIRQTLGSLAAGLRVRVTEKLP
jgi:hypothetical protein